MVTLLSGGLYALLFPKFNLAILSWIFAVPLILYIINYAAGGGSIKKSFLYGLLSGTFANLVIFYWIYNLLIRNGAGYIASLLGWGLLSIYLGIYWGIFASAVSFIIKADLRFKVFMIAAVWTLLEYIKAHIFTGFPWLLTGYALADNKFLVQTVSITGIYGMSFLIIYFNAALSFIIKKRKFKALIIPVSVILLSFLFGYNVLKSKIPSEKNIIVAVLQGNISQYEKWDSAYENKILNIYENLYEEASAFKPDLIVWPETSLPGSLNRDSKMQEYIKRLSSKSNSYNLVGSVENRRGKFYNSAYLVSPEGKFRNPYRKLHLVPFGEFIPFRKIMSPFIDVVNEVGDFSRGHEFKILNTEKADIATGICFEDIFPGLTSKFISRGASLYVNITNDGWYLDTAGPYQHFRHSIVRAVENRIWTVRAANTGISALISPYGEIIQKTELLKESLLVGTVGLKSNDTFYTKYGNIFIYLLAIIVAAVLWKDRKCLKNIKKRLKN